MLEFRKYQYTARAHQLTDEWRRSVLNAPNVKAKVTVQNYVDKFRPLREGFNPRELLVSTELQLRKDALESVNTFLRRPARKALTAFTEKGSGHAIRRIKNALRAFSAASTEEYKSLKTTTIFLGQAMGTRIELASLGMDIARMQRRTLQEVTKAPTRPRTPR